MSSSDVVYIEKRRGPRTDPCGTPVTSWCDLDTSPPQDTLKDLHVRLKPMECSSGDAQWREVLMINSFECSW